mmetsp:Transcript_9903/g.26950  ORF Transcript_9903/g.26950 Transcript_9903/m.26950 type:complete len:426 (-) Transcript_9903:1280-2557(-)
MPVADINQGARVREVDLHEERLDSDGRVEFRLPRDPFNLLRLSSLRRRLNILVVLLRILGKGHPRPEVEIQTRIRVVGLQQLDDLGSRELLRVLLCHIDDDRQILFHVRLQKHLQAFQGPFGTQRAEKLGQLGRLDGVCVDDDPLDVREIRVVLQGPHVQPRLFAQLRDPGLIVLGQRPVGEDGVGNLAVVHQVDFDQLGLEGRVLGIVTLQHIQQERRGLLDHLPLQKQISHGIEVDGRPRLAADHLGQVHGRIRVVHHQLLEQERIIRVGSRRLRVRHKLLKVALGRKYLHNASTRSARPENSQRRLPILLVLEQVAELLARRQLALLVPLVQQRLLLLGQHQPAQLDRLKLVQRARRQDFAKVHQQRALRPRLGWHALEALHRLLCAQYSLRRLSRELCGLLVLLRGKQVLELDLDEALGTR